jgi:hypothetical protein
VFEGFHKEFLRLARELLIGVTQQHITAITQLFNEAEEQYEKCVAFKRDNISGFLKNENLRPLVDAIYSNTKQPLNGFKNLSNINSRLRALVGSNIEQPMLENKRWWGKPMWKILTAIILPVIAITFALINPEVRHFFGLKPISSTENKVIPTPATGVTFNAPVQGPIIFSQGQSGGQVAGTINNYGLPKRTISPDVRVKMLEILRPAASCVALASTQGDMEAHEFKLLLMSVFQEAGWEVRDRYTFSFAPVKKGLALKIPVGASEKGVPQVIMRALALAGNPPQGYKSNIVEGCGALIEVWNAP